MTYIPEILRRIHVSRHVGWIASFGVFLVMTQCGISTGWISPNIIRLTSENSTIPLTADEVSWVASTYGLGGIFGAVMGSVFIEYIGSRKTIIWALSMKSLSWVCVFVANSAFWLYISRILGGICCAISYGSFSLFLGEASAPEIRGTLISFAASGTSFGTIVGTIAESYLPMRVSAVLYLCQCLVGLIILMWLLDTPYYIVKTNDFDAARKSIVLYHCESNVEEELKKIQEYVEADSSQSFKDKVKEFKSPVIRKSIILIIILYALPHLSGMMVIISYMGTILVKGKFSFMKQEEFVIFANLIGIISTFLTIRLIDKIGRRFLLIMSSIGTTVAMGGLAIHFYLINADYDPANLQWLPVASILIYLIAYAFGFSSVPSTVLSELFPDNIKSIASCIAILSAAALVFLVLECYKLMVDTIGDAYVFTIFAVFSFLATPCALFLLPETKGKTFQEIQNELQRR